MRRRTMKPDVEQVIPPEPTGQHHPVTFIDFTGWEETRYSVNGVVEPPTPNEYPNMVFERWSHTPEQLSNIQYDTVVGAHYDTDDGNLLIYPTINYEATEQSGAVSISLSTDEVSPSSSQITVYNFKNDAKSYSLSNTTVTSIPLVLKKPANAINPYIRIVSNIANGNKIVIGSNTANSSTSKELMDLRIGRNFNIAAFCDTAIKSAKMISYSEHCSIKTTDPLNIVSFSNCFALRNVIFNVENLQTIQSVSFDNCHTMKYFVLTGYNNTGNIVIINNCQNLAYCIVKKDATNLQNYNNLYGLQTFVNIDTSINYLLTAITQLQVMPSLSKLILPNSHLNLSQSPASTNLVIYTGLHSNPSVFAEVHPIEELNTANQPKVVPTARVVFITCHELIEERIVPLHSNITEYPTPPTYKHLTFDRWDTGADILGDVKSNLVVCARYRLTDPSIGIICIIPTSSTFSFTLSSFPTNTLDNYIKVDCYLDSDDTLFYSTSVRTNTNYNGNIDREIVKISGLNISEKYYIVFSGSPFYNSKLIVSNVSPTTSVIGNYTATQNFDTTQFVPRIFSEGTVAPPYYSRSFPYTVYSNSYDNTNVQYCAMSLNVPLSLNGVGNFMVLPETHSLNVYSTSAGDRDLTFNFTFLFNSTLAINAYSSIGTSRIIHLPVVSNDLTDFNYSSFYSKISYNNSDNAIPPKRIYVNESAIYDVLPLAYLSASSNIKYITSDRVYQQIKI